MKILKICYYLPIGGIKMKHIFILFYFTFLFLTMPLSATPTLNLQNNIEAYTNFDIEYFEDKSIEPLTLEQVKKEKFQTTSNAFAFGYNTHTFWFRVILSNTTHTDKEIFLELTEIIHKNIDLYVLSNDATVQHQKNGLMIPVKERSIKTSNPTFSIVFKPGEKKEVYVKLSSIYSVFGSIQFKTPKTFYYDNNFKNRLYMFYFGAVIMIGLYNLFIYIYLREKVYLYYISYVFTFVLWSANYKGILLPYITMEIYDMLQVTIPIFFFFLILFSQTILDTKKNFQLFHQLLNAYIVVLILSLFWMLYDMCTGFYLMNALALPLLPLLLFIAAWALMHGQGIAKIYLWALSIYLISMIILIHLALGLSPYNLWFSNAPIIGSFIEIILFSFLLAYHINILREEKLKMQTQLLRIKATESTKLIKMVNEQTAELHILNETLANELEEKKKLEKKLMFEASTDFLTGILNRRAFFEICTKEMNVAKRYNHHLSFIIIDIDYFKEINDTYGHLDGDIILKGLVNIVQNTIRTTDVFGRVGGEEFAVLMPETEIKNAKKLAERIRINIEQNENLLDEHNVKITVSIGLSLMRAEDIIIENVFSRADIALYKAKENGRNQLCCLDVY